MSDYLSEIDALLPMAIAAFDSKGDRPYVLDLIRVLLPGGRTGVQRGAALRAVEAARKASGMPMPAAFVHVVQAEFNRHCATSEVFKKDGAPMDRLFKTERIQGTAFWSVDPENAFFWLAARLVPTALPATSRGVTVLKTERLGPTLRST